MPGAHAHRAGGGHARPARGGPGPAARLLAGLIGLLVLLLAPVASQRDQPAHDVGRQPGNLGDVLERRVVIAGQADGAPRRHWRAGPISPRTTSGGSPGTSAMCWSVGSS